MVRWSSCTDCSLYKSLPFELCDDDDDDHGGIGSFAKIALLFECRDGNIEADNDDLIVTFRLGDHDGAGDDH